LLVFGGVCWWLFVGGWWCLLGFVARTLAQLKIYFAFQNDEPSTIAKISQQVM
jgi:hypothetical protein